MLINIKFHVADAERNAQSYVDDLNNAIEFCASMARSRAVAALTTVDDFASLVAAMNDAQKSAFIAQITCAYETSDDFMAAIDKLFA